MKRGTEARRHKGTMAPMDKNTSALLARDVPPERLAVNLFAGPTSNPRGTEWHKMAHFLSPLPMRSKKSYKSCMFISLHQSRSWHTLCRAGNADRSYSNLMIPNAGIGRRRQERILGRAAAPRFCRIDRINSEMSSAPPGPASIRLMSGLNPESPLPRV